VDFVHKVFDHKDFDHMEIDHVEFDHKEVDHIEPSDHFGCMEFAKQIEHTVVGKVIIIFAAVVAMVAGKIPIGIGNESIADVVSKVLVGVE